MMNNRTELVEAMSSLSPFLSSLKKSDSASIRYELLSGSLVWSDEIPTDVWLRNEWLRYVLNYRTGLIIGDPDPTLAVVWREAVGYFPNWIGFLPERTSYDSKLTEFYHKERSRLFNSIKLA
jgi:hypothetical protein